MDEAIKNAWLTEFGDDSHVSLHCYTLAYLAGSRTAIIECAELLMKPQPSSVTFCCLSTLSKVSEQILDKLAE